MKKFLLGVAAIATVSTGFAQATYNYFDAADVDANGWLWFDSQEKIDKYVGFLGMGAAPKIILLSSTWENGDGEYPEPYGDPNYVGYNAAGEEGGEGAKTGAIVLSEADPAGSTLFADNPTGGGIMLWLPDCAEFDLFLSTPNENIIPNLRGAKGHVPDIDCGVIRGYGNIPIFGISPLAEVSQFQWNNIQAIQNTSTGFGLASTEPVTGLVRSILKAPLLIQGIKLLTYTNTTGGGAGIDDVIAGSALKLAFTGDAVIASENAAISVYSATGAKMAEVNGNVISLKNFTPGTYVVKAVSDNGTATLKVVR